MDQFNQTTSLFNLAWKVGGLYTRRFLAAQETFLSHLQEAGTNLAAARAM
jgi:hypothetical protein